MREAAPARIGALDVLRGLAILGTFGANVWVFAIPGGALGFFAEGFRSGGFVEAALRLLVNGKFLALLTLLFGVGLELQYRSAVRRGLRWPGRYLVRASILFVEGLLHYVLIFEFDVLMAYAITSVVVAYLIGRSERVVRAWMVGVGGGYVAVIGAATALVLWLPQGQAGQPGVGPEVTASWLDQVWWRLDQVLLLRFETVVIVPQATVLFLLGVRLLRAGAFDNSAAGARIRSRLMLLGLGIGAPLNVLTALGGDDWFLVDRYLVPPLVSLGLLGLVTHLVLHARRGPGPVRRGLAAVGRTALSCYVLPNLLASVLCYGWGLGLAERFADLRPWWVVGLWFGVCLLCMVFATLWLRWFDRGPLEIVMHRVIAPRPARELAVLSASRH